jgi:hypothetical protein
VLWVVYRRRLGYVCDMLLIYGSARGRLRREASSGHEELLILSRCGAICAAGKGSILVLRIFGLASCAVRRIWIVVGGIVGRRTAIIWVLILLAWLLAVVILPVLWVRHFRRWRTCTLPLFAMLPLGQRKEWPGGGGCKASRGS